MGELSRRLGQDFPHLLFLIRFQGLGLVLFDDLLNPGVEPLAQRRGSGFQPLHPSLAVQETGEPKIVEAFQGLVRV